MSDQEKLARIREHLNCAIHALDEKCPGAAMEAIKRARRLAARKPEAMGKKTPLPVSRLAPGTAAGSSAQKGALSVKLTVELYHGGPDAAQSIQNMPRTLREFGDYFLALWQHARAQASPHRGRTAHAHPRSLSYDGPVLREEKAWAPS
jgi:hypothetical protein